MDDCHFKKILVIPSKINKLIARPINTGFNPLGYIIFQTIIDSGANVIAQNPK